MSRRTKLFFIILTGSFYAAFLIYGLYFNGIGVNVLATMGFFGLTSETAYGLIMTCAALGGIVMTILLGLFGERINKINGIAAGLALMGCASTMIGLLPLFMQGGSGFSIMLILSVIAGIGYITIDLLVNGIMGDLFPTKKQVLLPIAHAFYGIGSMCAPLFVTALVYPKAAPASSDAFFSRPYLILGLCALAVSVICLLTGRRVREKTIYADMSELKKRVSASPAEIFKDRRAWIYFFAGFFFVCFQTGMSAWLPYYSMNRFMLDSASGAAYLSLYFFGSLAMRFLSPVFYRFISVLRFYVITILLSAFLFAAFLLLPVSASTGKLMLALLGFLQGAAVPGLFILCGNTFPKRAASASAVLVLSIGVSALITPIIMGALIKGGNYLGAMLAITAGLPISVILTVVAAKIRQRPASPRSRSARSPQ